MKEESFSYDNYVTPVYKQDVTMSFSPATIGATIGEDFIEPVLTTTPAGLAVTYSSSKPDIATVNEGTGKVTLLAAGTTIITATFAGNASYNEASTSYTLNVAAATPVEDTNIFELVTDASTLAAGDKVLIAYVNGTTAKAMSATQNTNNRSAVDVTLNSDETLTPGNDAQVIALEKDGTNFLFNVGNGYLYAASSSNNYLKTETTADNNAKATISISSNDATITFQGTNTRNVIRYNPNNNSPIFSCYSSSSTVGSLPQIYRMKHIMIPDITLADDADNSSTISSYIGKEVNATLDGRTLYKDNTWNTLCLPFDVTLSGSILDGAIAMELSSASLSGSTLTLNFSNVTTLEAGKPYIIKWTSGDNLINPIFNGVTIDNTTPTDVNWDVITFKGLYNPYTIPGEDRTLLYMGSDNNLYYPSTAIQINAFRAYFQLDENNNPSNIVLNIDEGGTTGVASFETHGNNGTWYSLDGRKFNKKPTQKGIYIYQGRKVVIK